MPLTNKTILVTGASGLVGTNLALSIQSLGGKVIGLDCRENTWTDAFPIHLCDLSDPSKLCDIAAQSNWANEIDLVVHLAAHPKVHQSVKEPQNFGVNVVMAHAATEFCRQWKLPIIFSSSREVYGNAPIEVYEEERSDFLHAASPYAAGKIAAEALIYSYARCYGLRYLVLRLSNVYGRFDSDIERMERVIPLFTRQIAQLEPVTIFDVEKILDFTYVDDCVAGIVKGVQWLLNPANASHTMNLASGRGHTLLELVQMIGASLGVEPIIHRRPTRPGEVRRYVACTQRAQSLLGYTPTTPLAEGVRARTHWWKSWAKDVAMV